MMRKKLSQKNTQTLKLNYPNYNDYKRLRKQKKTNQHEILEIKKSNLIGSIYDNCFNGDILMEKSDLQDLFTNLKNKKPIRATIIKYGSRKKY